MLLKRSQSLKLGPPLVPLTLFIDICYQIFSLRKKFHRAIVIQKLREKSRNIRYGLSEDFLSIGQKIVGGGVDSNPSDSTYRIKF